jgi:hypothetical protein
MLNINFGISEFETFEIDEFTWFWNFSTSVPNVLLHCRKRRTENRKCHSLWNHLPIVFHILDHVRTTTRSEPLEKSINWEWFQSLASDLIYPRMEVNSEVEADKAVHHFTASVASAYRLSTSKVTLSDLDNDLPGIDRMPTTTRSWENSGKKLGMRKHDYKILRPHLKQYGQLRSR